MYICVYVDIYTYIYTYICTYIHSSQMLHDHGDGSDTRHGAINWVARRPPQHHTQPHAYTYLVLGYPRVLSLPHRKPNTLRHFGPPHFAAAAAAASSTAACSCWTLTLGGRPH